MTEKTQFTGTEDAWAKPRVGPSEALAEGVTAEGLLSDSRIKSCGGNRRN
jgi:hypothetical protein